MSYHQATLKALKQKIYTKKIIFLGNISMTQIMDSNRFCGKINFPKFWSFNGGLTHIHIIKNIEALFTSKNKLDQIT